MGDSIHKTHFQVPELPYKRKEQEAVLLLQRILRTFNDVDSNEEEIYSCVVCLTDEHKDLVDWVMKYKGE